MTDLNAQRYKRVAALEDRLGYQFKDRELALRALTHSSCGEGQRTVPDNQRLEFLGDRVLGLMTAQTLYHYSTEAEGTLARRLNALVRKETCARIARQLGVGEAVLISPAEEKQGGRDKLSILGDTMEALIAAIYLDGGLDAANAFYNAHWMAEFTKVVSKSAKDPKTQLQEMAMAHGAQLPRYHVKDRSGPDHKPLFQIIVDVDGVGSASGEGRSKRDGERNAAAALIKNWSKTGPN